MPTPEELLQQELAKQQTEWGTYRAAAPIYIDGVRAFNPGDPVPVSHVTSGVVASNQVSQASTEQAESAPQEPPAATEPPVEDNSNA